MCAFHRRFAYVAVIAALLFVTDRALAQTPKTPEPKKDTSAAAIGKTLSKAVGDGVVVDLGHGVKMDLVPVQPGSFMMGDEKGGDDEKPVHKVEITKPFYIGTGKVTQEQWEAVMGKTPSTFSGTANPVENVSWEDCQEFLKKLNAKLGAAGKFSLPTEAQWEYACRAGTTTPYYFGKDAADLSKHAWFLDNSAGKTHPVGVKKPNAWGLHDMQGDVWEWCADGYDKDYFKKSPATDPTGPADAAMRVCRSSSWGSPAADCRSAFRLFAAPSDRFSYIGLRVVRATK